MKANIIKVHYDQWMEESEPHGYAPAMGGDYMDAIVGKNGDLRIYEYKLLDDVDDNNKQMAERWCRACYAKNDWTRVEFLHDGEIDDGG